MRFPISTVSSVPSRSCTFMDNCGWSKPYFAGSSMDFESSRWVLGPPSSCVIPPHRYRSVGTASSLSKNQRLKSSL